MPEIKYQLNQQLGECIYLGDDYYVGRNRHAKFKCRCGEIFGAAIIKIKNGHTKSCGCLHKEMITNRNKKHGYAERNKKPKEYFTWVHMKQRCYNSKVRGYKNWGGRGITVCDRWRFSFENFINDMGTCPKGFRGLDRRDNDKGYYKENCRWATPTMQMRNTRMNRVINYEGEQKTLSEWLQILNITKGSFYYWANKGISDSEILKKLKK